MQNKSTDELNNEIMSACNLDEFLSENQTQLQVCSIRDLLNQMIRERGIRKAVLAKRSGMSEVYIHQILSGRRKPSRDRILCMAFGLSATPEETQDLLRRCGYASLYPRIKRDAVILYGLSNQKDLFDINDRLFEIGEETLL